ncbi:MAG: hypothetical protein O6909_04760 [Alphaproteobacteria bacterium]|nr:hypothetical protein [Alphaproteobacteria bacterium]
MSEYRYSTAALKGDLVRASIGFALCATPIAFASLEAWLMILLAAPAGLFAIFGARTWLRRGIRVAMDETGIAVTGPNATRISWRELHRFKLSYFSTRRDRSNGWMQLKLRGPSGRLSIDSNFEGFDDICQRAFRAATDNDVELSGATLRNLAELGLVVDTATKLRSSGGVGWGNPADWRR